MKKIDSIFKYFGLLMAILFVGCTEPKEGNFLSMSANGVVFDAQGGTKSVDVTTYPEGIGWSVVTVEQCEWLTCKVENSSIAVSVQPNLSDKERHAELKVSAVDGEFDSRILTVSQEGAEMVVFSTSAADSYTFDSRGGVSSFTVEANREWSVECDAEWISIESKGHLVTISAEEHYGAEERLASVVLSVNGGDAEHSKTIGIVQQTEAQNRYLNLVGSWEITATNWFYTTNGSLNPLQDNNGVSYAPEPSQYYLIFDIKEGEYGKTLIMKNFLYPGTSLEVTYDAESGGFIIPFGWTVLSYDVFLYVTLITDTQFLYASYEVAATPLEDGTSLLLNMPQSTDFTYVGFGLWTYKEDGLKWAFGSKLYPTMFPMGKITFVKQ